jgi:hypothetical protein
MRPRLLNTTRLIAAILAITLLCSCSSALVANMDDRDPEFHSRPLIQDNILAIGKVARNERIDQEAGASLAFLGEKNSYLVIEGAEVLLNIASSTVGPLIEVNPAYGLEKHNVYVQNQIFWGDLTLVTANNAIVSDEQQQLLTALGFEVSGKTNRHHYVRRVPIKGTISPPVSLPPAMAMNLSHARPLALYPSPDEKAPINISKVLLTPPALVADIVTAPVQILGIGALMIYIEANGGLKIIQ